MRLFLALLPSDPSRAQLEKWQQQYRHTSPRCKPVSPGMLHMTLLFNGKGGPEDLQLFRSSGERLKQRMEGEEILLRNPDLHLTSQAVPGLGILSFSENRVLDPPFGIMGDFLAEYGQKKPFWPHITLFRRFYPIQKESLSLSEISLFTFSSIILYESLLHPEGASYRKLDQWKLESKGTAGV